MEKKYDVWKSEGLSKVFLENVRGAIPFASEQVGIMMRIIQTALPDVKTVLDLGCGDGILGRSILSRLPRRYGAHHVVTGYYIDLFYIDRINIQQCFSVINKNHVNEKRRRPFEYRIINHISLILPA